MGYNREYSQRRTLRNAAIRDAAKARPCADCKGRFDPVCMDFDHHDGKKFDIGSMNTHAEETLLAEIAKCDVVCANCHRLRTQRRRHESARRVA